jgi:hypothetical protein
MQNAYNTPTRLPAALQVAASELLDQLLAETASPPPPVGVPVSKLLRGRRYWYAQTTAQGRNRQTYLGADDDAAVQRQVTAMRARKERMLLCSALRPMFGPALAGAMVPVLAALHGAGLYRTGAVVVGTYAFVAYQGVFALRWPTAAATDDLDLAVKLAAPAPTKLDLWAVLTETGLGFEPVRHLDTADPPVMFAVPGTRLRVDVLTPAIGRASQRTRPAPTLHAHAQPLRFLDYLIDEPVPAALPVSQGVLLRVPQPGRFALHKLLLLARRDRADKRVKDRAQAVALLGLLATHAPHELATAWQALGKWPATWRRDVVAQVRRLPDGVKDRVLPIL